MKRILHSFLISILLLSPQFTTQTYPSCGDCNLQPALLCLSYIKNQLVILSSAVSDINITVNESLLSSLFVEFAESFNDIIGESIIDGFNDLSLSEQLHFISLNQQIATCCDTLHSQLERLESIIDDTDNAILLSAISVVSSQISDLTIDELDHFSIVNSNLATCCTTLESQLSTLIQSINTSIVDLINTAITQVTGVSALDTLHFSIIENNIATCCATLSSQIGGILLEPVTGIGINVSTIDAITSVTEVLQDLSAFESLHFSIIENNLATCCDALNAQVEDLSSFDHAHFSYIEENLVACCGTLNSQISALQSAVEANNCTSLINAINNVSTQITNLSLFENEQFTNVTLNIGLCCDNLSSQISQIDGDLATCCSSINTQLADLLTLDLSLNAQLGNLLGLNLNLGSQLLNIQDLQLTLNGDIAGLNLANVTLNAQLLNLLDNDLTLNAQLAGINLANVTLSSVLQDLELNNLSVNAQLGSILQSNLGLSAQLGVVTSLLDLLLVL